MVGVWMLATLMTVGPGAGDEVVLPPPPSLDPRGPIEGPARPPSPAAESDESALESEQLDAESDGPDEFEAEPERPIEFAPPPPSELESRAVSTEPAQADHGQAPTDGAGAMVAGAVIIPSAALLLLAVAGDSGHKPISTIAVGAGLGLIGAGLIGLGGYRRYKLNRWARARGVIPQRQGAGLLMAGGFAAGFGASLIGGGIVLLASSSAQTGGVIIGAGVLLGAIAPAPLVIGTRRRAEYRRTGGWIRRPMTHIELAPRVIVGRDGFGVGVTGRF